MVFLPFYLPNSSLMREPRKGWTALALWVAGQVTPSLYIFTRLVADICLGSLAPAGGSTRVLRRLDIRAWTLACKHFLLCS